MRLGFALDLRSRTSPDEPYGTPGTAHKQCSLAYRVVITGLFNQSWVLPGWLPKVTRRAREPPTGCRDPLEHDREFPASRKFASTEGQCRFFVSRVASLGSVLEATKYSIL